MAVPSYQDYVEQVKSGRLGAPPPTPTPPPPPVRPIDVPAAMMEAPAGVDLPPLQEEAEAKPVKIPTYEEYLANQIDATPPRAQDDPTFLQRVAKNMEAANQFGLEAVDAMFAGGGPGFAAGMGDIERGRRLNPLRVAAQITKHIGDGMTETLRRASEKTISFVPESVKRSPALLGFGQFIRGPAEIPRVVGEFGESEFLHIPITTALGIAGRAGRASGLAAEIGKQVEKVAPSLVFRGGTTQEFQRAAQRADITAGRGAIEAQEIAQRIVTGGDGKALSVEAQNLTGYLMSQPKIRNSILTADAADRDVKSLHKFLRLNAEPVPGRLETLTQGGLGRVPKEISEDLLEAYHGEIKSMTQIAQEAAEAFGRHKGDIIKEFEKNPTLFSRFNELNYHPVVLARDRMAMWPSRASRGEKAGFMQMRKDLEKAQREALGELPTGAAVGIRLTQESRAIANRRLMNEVAQMPRVTLPETAGLVGDSVVVRGQRYVRMPDSDLYGPLKNRFVREAEATDIRGSTEIFNPKSAIRRDLEELWGAYKFGKVVLSPKTQLANNSSNVMMAWKAGLSPYRMDIYADAADSLRFGTDRWAKELKELGAPWMSKIGNVMDDVMPRELLQKGPGANMVTRGMLAVPRFMKQADRFVMKGAGFEKGLSDYAAQVYQGSEAFFKQAVYIANRKAGVGPMEAMRIADRGLVNYDRVPHWVKKTRSFPGGPPFITFTYGATPLIMESVIERPDIWFHAKLLYDAINEVQAENFDISPENLQSIKDAFPDDMVVLSGVDANGFPLIHRGARYTPVAQHIPGREAISGFGGAIGGLAQNVALASPLINEIAAQSTGVDPFFKTPFLPHPEAASEEEFRIAGRVFREPESMQDLIDQYGQVTMQNLSARGAHLARTILPDLLGGGAFQNIVAAARGKPAFLGHQITLADALRDAILGQQQMVLSRTLELKRKVERAPSQIKKAAVREERTRMAREGEE